MPSRVLWGIPIHIRVDTYTVSWSSITGNYCALNFAHLKGNQGSPERHFLRLGGCFETSRCGFRLAPSWLSLISRAKSTDLYLPDWFLFYGGWHEVIQYCVIYRFSLHPLSPSFLNFSVSRRHKSPANDPWRKYYNYYSWRVVTNSIALINWTR